MLNNTIPEFQIGEDFYWIIDVGEDISASGWDAWAGIYSDLSDNWGEGIGEKSFGESPYITKLDSANGLFLVRFHRSELIDSSVTPGNYFVNAMIEKPDYGRVIMLPERLRLTANPMSAVS